MSDAHPAAAAATADAAGESITAGGRAVVPASDAVYRSEDVPPVADSIRRRRGLVDRLTWLASRSVDVAAPRGWVRCYCFQRTAAALEPHTAGGSTRGRPHTSSPAAVAPASLRV